MSDEMLAQRAHAPTGLGWPRRALIGHLLGWPRVSRETPEPGQSDANVDLSASGADSTADDSGLPEEPRPRRARADLADDVVPAPTQSAGGPDAEDQGSTEDTAVDTQGPVAEVTIVEPEPALPAPIEEADLAVRPTDEPLTPPEDGRVPVSRETRPLIEALPKPDHPRVIVVANQKGGVGKTTTAVNVAAALAFGGLRVVLIDLDPQGNASTALGVDHRPGTPGTYEVLIGGDPLEDHLCPSPEADGLSVLPATVDLAGAEIELVSVVARENRLRRALTKFLKSADVDYVFLDCPPSLGLITLNALVAAQEIMVPIQCEYYALEGVSQLMNTIELVKGELNDELELTTVLLTMYDARTRLAAQVADEVRNHFAAQTLPGVVPRSVRISEAPSYGQTVLTYQPDSAGARSYLDAARQIARRGQAGEAI